MDASRLSVASSGQQRYTGIKVMITTLYGPVDGVDGFFSIIATQFHTLPPPSVYTLYSLLVINHTHNYIMSTVYTVYTYSHKKIKSLKKMGNQKISSTAVFLPEPLYT